MSASRTPPRPCASSALGSTYAFLVAGWNVYQLSLSTYAVTLVTTLAPYAATSPIDLVGMQSGTPTVVYASAVGTITLKRFTYGASPSVAATNTITSSIFYGVAAAYISTAILVAATTGSFGATLYHCDPFTLAPDAGFAIATTGATAITGTVDVVSYAGADAGAVYVFPGSTANPIFCQFQAFAGAATSGAESNIAGGGSLLGNVSHQESRVFAYGGRAYMAIRAGQQAQLADVTALATTTSVRPVAAWSPRLSDAHVQPMQATIAPGSLTTYLPWRTLTAAVGAGVSSSVGVVSLTPSAGLPSCSPYGLSAVVGGGVPTTYDGASATEMGFFTEPQGTSYTVTTGGTYSGTASVCCCWAWVNGRGEIERSAPSTPGQVTSTNGSAIACIFVPLAVSSRPNLLLEFYRTTAGGTTFYYAGSVVPNTATGFSQTYNIAIASSGAGSDAALSTQRLLYAQPGSLGGSLARFCPPSLVSLFPFQDRVFGLAEDGQTIWFSGQYVSGEVPWWQDQFTLTVPVRSSDVVALAGQQGNLYAFRRSGIVMFSGYGPPDNGQGGTFSDPTELPTEVGCIEPRSVVSTSMGIFFQSPRGLDLLDTGNNVSWIGRPVDQLLQQYPVITSAQVSEVDKRVVFTCLPSGPGQFTGISLAYDLINQMWTSLSAQDARNAGSGINSACLVATVTSGLQTVRATLSTGGYVYLEDRSTYLQEGAYQPSAIVPGSIKVSGLQGYQRLRAVQIKTNAVTPHDLIVSVATNDGPFLQSHTFTWAQIQALKQQEHLLFSVQDQKCSSVTVMLQDVAPSNGAALGTGAGPTYVSMALDVLTLNGAARLPKGAR